MIINLVQNALDALTDRQQGIEVSVTYSKSKQEISVHVRDEGCGIPQDQLKFINDPFYTTKRESGGTGLGLSVSNRIINDHHGRLEVNSDVGKGTTFTLVLPAYS